MPVLEIPNLSREESAYRASIDVLSVMLFPQDTEERLRFQTALVARHLSLAENGLEQESGRHQIPSGVSPDILEAGEFREWHHISLALRSMFEQIGGFRRLTHARSLAEYDAILLSRSRSWFSAGLILALVRRMDAHHHDLPGGPSVNKAVYILEQCKHPLTHHNSHSIRKAWSEYKSVAHLCAAFYDFFAELIDSGIPTEEFDTELPARFTVEFGVFLANAEGYLDFGLSYKPPRTKGSTLLDENEVWRLPDKRCWPVWKFEPAPLTDVGLEIAKKYQAPIPGV